MGELVLYLVVAVLVAWTVCLDVRAGKVFIPGRPNRRNKYLKRRDSPILFVTVLVLRGLGAALLALLLTGRFLSLIEASI